MFPTPDPGKMRTEIRSAKRQRRRSIENTSFILLPNAWQKRFHRLVKCKLVFLVMNPWPSLSLTMYSTSTHACAVRRQFDLIRLVDARILRALRDEQRRFDFVRMQCGEVAASNSLSSLRRRPFMKHVEIRFPVGRDRFHKRKQIGNLRP